MHKNKLAHKTDSGLFSFIFMVLIACGVAWWYGWDKMALSYFNTAVNTGQAAKQNLDNQVQGVKDIMKDRDTQIFKEMGEEPTN